MTDKDAQAQAARLGSLQLFNFAFAHFDVGTLGIDGKSIAGIGTKFPGPRDKVCGEIREGHQSWDKAIQKKKTSDDKSKFTIGFEQAEAKCRIIHFKTS